MGFLSKVKNVLSSPSVVEKAAEGAFKGLDAIWHTAEEKEGDHQKRIELALKMLEATKGASPARRSIAMIVMYVWAFVGLNIVLLVNLSAFTNVPETAEALASLSDTRIDLAIDRLTEFAIDYVAKPTGLVLAFYFLKNIIPSK